MSGNGSPRRDLLVLRLTDAFFGLWVDEVLEIVRTPPVSLLPLAAPELAGVTSVRGDLLPVLDLGVRLLGAPSARPGRLVVVRHHGSGSLVGLLVDDVRTLLDVAEEEVQAPPPAAEANLAPELMAGVVVRPEGVVTVLHIGRAAAPPQSSNNER
jgi:purine-binding chemotaxis protein CheW